MDDKPSELRVKSYELRVRQELTNLKTHKLTNLKTHKLTNLKTYELKNLKNHAKASIQEDKDTY